MSFGEIIVVLIVAILLFGPDKLPEIARGLGQGVRKLKQATEDIKNDIMEGTEKNEDIKEIEKEIEEAKKALNDWEGPIKRK